VRQSSSPPQLTVWLLSRREQQRWLKYLYH